MNKYLLAILLAILFAMPLAAAEKVSANIKLPDGLYLYNFEINQLKDGSISVKSPSFFLARSNVIYSSLDALKKYGTKKINKLFILNKNFKLLSAGETIGRVYQVEIREDGRISLESEIFIEDIKENPIYGEGSGHGSISRCVAVPEEYEAVKIRKHDAASKKEVDRVKKLIKEKLFHLVKQRKEYSQSYSQETLKHYSTPPLSYKNDSFRFEELHFLDTISYLNDQSYIGLYWYHFKEAPVLQIVFSVKRDTLTIVTTNHDDATLDGGEMTVRGMLDIDGCGKQELITIKGFGPYDVGHISNIEFHKHKADGNWVVIQKIVEDSAEWVHYDQKKYDVRSAALTKQYAKNIKLPNGIYMYDSSVEQQKDGNNRVGFQKYFVVHNNNIYSSRQAFNKFGVSKLNTLFGEKKKYKILGGGEVVGEKYNLRFEKEEGTVHDDADYSCNEKYFAKIISEGPAYGKGSGSATKLLAVPEDYKRVDKKVFTKISQGEVNKIEKLAKDKLLSLLINRKEVYQSKIKPAQLDRGDLGVLDKISYKNNDLYFGTYEYVFETPEDNYRYDVVFSVNDGALAIITTDYDDETADYDGQISICGMLDVDGCGDEEMIVEKASYGEDEARINISIYKRKTDGSWARIQKVAWR